MSPGICSNSWSLIQWRYQTISLSATHFSSGLQSFPASGYFPMSQHFTSDSQSIGASASVSVLPMNIQDWFPLRWTGLISMQPKGLSRVFSNTTVQNHRFFGTHLSLWSDSHIHTWLLEKALLLFNCQIVSNPLWPHGLQQSFPGGSDGKESAYKAEDGFDPWVRKTPWRRWDGLSI